MNYQDYIRESPVWQTIRARELQRSSNCCEFCGWQSETSTGLHVHHLNYDHVGSESSNDLIVLCADCHGDVHEFPRIAEGVQRLADYRNELHHGF